MGKFVIYSSLVAAAAVGAIALTPVAANAMGGRTQNQAQTTHECDGTGTGASTGGTTQTQTRSGAGMGGGQGINTATRASDPTHNCDGTGTGQHLRQQTNS